MSSQKILITGASGLIGTRLTKALQAAGHTVLAAVRRDARNEHEVKWVPERGEIEKAKLEGIDGIVHLAGANIAGQRWSDTYKQEIRESRVKGTKLISETIASLDQKPKVFASSSAIGYYGDRGDAKLDECNKSFA
jgi:NAD dependent epimerase/dehydratase family enzyme